MTESQPNPLHPTCLGRLDPQFVEIYNKYQAHRLQADQVTYEVYDADRAKYNNAAIPGAPYPEVGSIKLFKIPVSDPAGEISIQIYTPTEDAIAAGGLKTVDGKLPIHVDYHGGGFVIGDLKSDESWCRQAAQAVGCLIANVDYRLAPKYPHPVPLMDSWAALKWVFANAEELKVDTSKVSIGGLSAGGHISAGVALLARDEPDMPELVLQILVVPCVDTRFVPLEGSCDPSVPYKSYVENEFAPCLPLNRLRWFYALWLGTDMEERKKITEDWKASPILASSHANLAPASLHVAGVDTLTSEGIAYHEVLTKAGTPSTLKVYEGVGHPFGHWDGQLDKGKEYVKDTVAALKKAYRA